MAGMLSGCGSERHSQVSRAAFRSTVDGKATDLYTLRNARGLEMTVTNFGGRVVELWVPDRDGNFADIVLGHDNLGAYVDQTGERFLGATIGRYGNRIAAGRFTLDGKEYTLPLNDGPNSLHGGAKGFDMVVWDVVEVTPQKIVLACLSPDGVEVARGLSNYSSSDARRIARHASQDIEDILGYVDEPEIIHRDNLILC